MTKFVNGLTKSLSNVVKYKGDHYKFSFVEGYENLGIKNSFIRISTTLNVKILIITPI